MAKRLVVSGESVNLHTPLFDRFESGRPADLGSLARDIADILGARRAHRGALPGVLSWGLPDMSGLTPTSEKDQETIAAMVERVIERFEPRLENVRVIPVRDAVDFTFTLEADLVQSKDDSITLRILSPRRGGALGADIEVIGGRR